MPDRDGTGPAGKGPMTGKLSGSCVLRIPDNRDEPIHGFAGEAGWPFGGHPNQEENKMPGGDRTGPRGMGPRTGRAAGFCRGFGAPGSFNRSSDLDSRGGNRGGGRRNRFFQSGGPGGWSNQGGGAAGMGFAPNVGQEDRVETLRAQAMQMEKTLDMMKQRIRQLETGQKEI